MEIIDTRNLVISLPIKKTFSYPIRYIIDTRNLVISLPIKETFSYPIRYTEWLKKKEDQEKETNPIRIKY